MTNNEALEADLISMLRGNRWSHKDAEQMSSRIVQGIRDIAIEIADNVMSEHTEGEE